MIVLLVDIVYKVSYKYLGTYLPNRDYWPGAFWYECTFGKPLKENAFGIWICGIRVRVMLVPNCANSLTNENWELDKMQAYGESMALAYDTIWGAYACKAAGEIIRFHSRRADGQGKKVLDLCCGAGQLAEMFLKQGYDVTGVDLSASMLDRARARCREFVSSGKAQFVEADAASFVVDGPFDLMISTYDALNHLDSIAAIENCFRCVRRVAAPGAPFLFDFSTLKGLDEWNRIVFSDKDHAAVITRGFFDHQSNKGYKKFTGFLKTNRDCYRRFQEVIFALGYPLSAVENALRAAGFADVRITVLGELEGTSADPEAEDRVFFVAQSPA